MEEETLYDEFGNYIGPDLNESDNESSSDGDDRSGKANSSDYAYEKQVSTDAHRPGIPNPR